MKALLSIALAAALLHAAPAFGAAKPKDPVASPELRKEFETFIAKFRAALKANDSAAVAAMTKLPYEADTSIRDAATFHAKIYKQDFTAKNRSCLQRTKAVYDRDQLKNEHFFLFCGDAIFIFTKTPEGFLFTDIGVND